MAAQGVVTVGTYDKYPPTTQAVVIIGNYGITPSTRQGLVTIGSIDAFTPRLMVY